MELTLIVIVGLVIACTYLLMRLRMTATESSSLRNMLRQSREQMFTMQEQVSAEQHKSISLSETMVDPVLYINTDRVITGSNTAARQLTKDEGLQGSSLMEALRSYELDNAVQEIFSDTQELPREVTLNERLFRIRVGLIVPEDKSQGAVVILRDVSELQRLGRARRDFVANISHELRTPLTATRLLVDTLRMTIGVDEQKHFRQLDQISSQVDTLTQLAQEMYDLSLIESGQVPMRMVATDMHTLVDKIVASLTPQAERAGITLLNEISTDVLALVDPDQISRVLTNLLHNAIKFTPRGQVRVLISDVQSPQNATDDANARTLAANSDEYWTIAVRDTGMGITRTDISRIFERFYKVSQARGQGGTGLGLAIAKHIVEAHGGRIWVESTQGQGATFYFSVPRD